MLKKINVPIVVFKILYYCKTSIFQSLVGTKNISNIEDFVKYNLCLINNEGHSSQKLFFK